MYRRCRKLGLCSYILPVVLSISEGDIGLHIDDDGEVEDDEADHQMLVDGKARAVQRTK